MAIANPANPPPAINTSERWSGSAGIAMAFRWEPVGCWVERSEPHHWSYPRALAHMGPPVMGFAFRSTHPTRRRVACEPNEATARPDGGGTPPLRWKRLFLRQIP